MKRKITRSIFFIFIAGVAIATIIGYQLWNKPHKDIKDAHAIKTTAIALYSYLTNDSSRMKSVLINKIVAASGEVKVISKNQQDQQILLLETNIPGASVNCTMEEAVNNIKVGETILLKGICIGYIGGDKDMGLPGDVFLIRCYRSS